MSVSKGGSRQSQNATTNIDPVTQQRMQEMWQAAQAAGAAGPSPLVTGAGDFFSEMMKRGNLGMGALSGDAAAAGQLMNPYQQQVIGEMQKAGQVQDASTMAAMDDAATKARAFGGSRHGVATGVALGENARNRSGQIAGLLSSGFENTMGRAANLAGMGYNAAGSNANLGMGGVGSPEQWRLMMQRLGYQGPMGQTSSGTTTGTKTEFGTPNIFKMFE